MCMHALSLFACSVFVGSLFLFVVCCLFFYSSINRDCEQIWRPISRPLVQDSARCRWSLLSLAPAYHSWSLHTLTTLCALELAPEYSWWSLHIKDYQEQVIISPLLSFSTFSLVLFSPFHYRPCLLFNYWSFDFRMNVAKWILTLQWPLRRINIYIYIYIKR